MAAGLGVSSAMISYIESGRRTAGLDLARRHLRVLRALAWHQHVSREIAARRLAA